MAKKSVKEIKTENYKSSRNILKNRWIMIAVILLIIVALFLIVGPFFTGRVVSDPEGQELLRAFREAGISTSLLDSDRDGLLLTIDNCPTIANRDQIDIDGDKVGNVCDPHDDRKEKVTDSDEDGLPDREVFSSVLGRNIIDPSPFVWTNVAILLSNDRRKISSYWSAEVREEIRRARPSPTGTETPTPTPTGTASPSPTATGSPSPSPTGTETPAPTTTPTEESSSSESPSPSPT